MLPERAFELLAIRREQVIAKGGAPAKKAAATKKAAAKKAGGQEGRRQEDSEAVEPARRSPGRGHDPGSWWTSRSGGSLDHSSTMKAVTMPNMPSSRSAWVRMWQCQAHTPGSVIL